MFRSMYAVKFTYIEGSKGRERIKPNTMDFTLHDKSTNMIKIRECYFHPLLKISYLHFDYF